jgi:hypothetical protein
MATQSEINAALGLPPGINPDGSWNAQDYIARKVSGQPDTQAQVDAANAANPYSAQNMAKVDVTRPGQYVQDAEENYVALTPNVAGFNINNPTALQGLGELRAGGGADSTSQAFNAIATPAQKAEADRLWSIERSRLEEIDRQNALKASQGQSQGQSQGLLGITGGQTMSPALSYSLSRGISQEQFDKNLVDAIKQGEAQGLSDAQFESLMNQYQISAADVARATQSTPAIIQSRMQAATPTTPAEIAYNQAAMAELAGRQGTNQQQIATNEKAYQEYLRLNEAKNQQQIASNLALSNEQKRLNEIKNQQQIAANLALSNEQKRLNEIKNQEQISANLALSNEQKRLNEIKNQEQIATNQKAYEAYLANQAKLAAGQVGGTGVLEQNFRNYQSIAPGAQYDPSVTGGVSPYSKIMGQMSPLTNPYAGMAINQPMGGYNPGLYDQIAAVNTAKAAADAAAATTDPGQISDGLAQGGMVHGGLMFGPNPPGPDDGAVNLDLGEYVIKKSSVNKYGRGLLDMINEGKVPAKKLKSLLG